MFAWKVAPEKKAEGAPQDSAGTAAAQPQSTSLVVHDSTDPAGADQRTRTWRTSSEGAQARRRFLTVALVGMVMAYLGVFLAFAPLLTGASYFGLDPQLSTLLGVTSVLTGTGTLLTAATSMNTARAAFYADAEARAQGAADKAIEEVTDPDDLLGLMRANKKQMEAYDALARSQASTAYVASMIAGAIGLLAIVAGVLVVVFTGDASTKYAAAFLTAAGTATSGYVAKTFIRVQDGTMDQMRFYFQQPLVQSYLLSAERLVSHLPEDRKGEQYERVIGALIAQAHRNDHEATVTSPSR